MARAAQRETVGGGIARRVSIRAMIEEAVALRSRHVEFRHHRPKTNVGKILRRASRGGSATRIRQEREMTRQFHPGLGYAAA
jgi:acyl-coenzyme A synthetase/AMP-(fatty) acid ligase